jgi:hypothetical protein
MAGPVESAVEGLISGADAMLARPVYRDTGWPFGDEYDEPTMTDAEWMELLAR